MGRHHSLWRIQKFIIDTLRAGLHMARHSIAALLDAGPAVHRRLLSPRRKRKRQMEFPWNGLT